jgi:hypothetical protein
VIADIGDTRHNGISPERYCVLTRSTTWLSSDPGSVAIRAMHLHFHMSTTISLGQCEWGHAKCQQQEKVKRASNKMRFHSWVNGHFHKSSSKLMIDSAQVIAKGEVAQ